MHFIYRIAPLKTIAICAVLASWYTPVCAEIISVPFGWKAGQTRIYSLTTSIERLGNLKGGNCTLHGQLRVEIMRRNKISARARFQLSAFKFEQSCLDPSVRQIMWLQLSDVPIIMDMEPVSGKVSAPEAPLIRESFFRGLEQSKVWLGRDTPPALRKEVSERLREIFTTDDAFVSSVGFVAPLIYAVGGNYNTQSSEVTQADLPSPFGGSTLPASITTVTKASTPTSKDFTLTVTTRYDQKAYLDALKAVVIKLAANKLSPTETSQHLNRVNIEAGSSGVQRIERSTGWTMDSEFKLTTIYNEGQQIDIVKLVYLPEKK